MERGVVLMILKIFFAVITIIAFIFVINLILKPMQVPQWASLKSELESVNNDMSFSTRDSFMQDISANPLVEGIIIFNEEDFESTEGYNDLKEAIKCQDVENSDMYILALPHLEGITWYELFTNKDKFFDDVKGEIQRKANILSPICQPLSCGYCYFHPTLQGCRCVLSYDSENIPSIQGGESGITDHCLLFSREDVSENTASGDSSGGETIVTYSVEIHEGKCSALAGGSSGSASDEA